MGGIPAEISTEVLARLAELQNSQRVFIPLAIESGSRAWGFSSPDSDFDCRFIFVRSLDQYLSPWAGRDVIDPPIDGDFDINGWELGKALKLMLKGNAVILEWLQSPVAYSIDAAFRAEFLQLAQRYADRCSIGYHYLHLGERQWRTYFGDGEGEIAIKKVFYALRPAVALRWLEIHSDSAVPPMNFQSLLAGIDLNSDVEVLVSDLLRRKAVTRELGQSKVPRPLVEFITSQYSRAGSWLTERSPRPTREAKAEVAAFFQSWVLRLNNAA